MKHFEIELSTKQHDGTFRRGVNMVILLDAETAIEAGTKKEIIYLVNNAPGSKVRVHIIEMNGVNADEHTFNFNIEKNINYN